MTRTTDPRWWAALALLLAACAADVEGLAAGVQDASSPRIETVVTSAQLAFCRCHHGFGPGIDGALEIEIVNPGPSLVEASVLSLSVVSEDDARRFDSDASADLRISTDRAVGRYARVEVAPGSRVAARLSVYLDIDVGAEPLPAGRYRVELVLTVAGVQQSVRSELIEVAADA